MPSEEVRNAIVGKFGFVAQYERFLRLQVGKALVHSELYRSSRRRNSETVKYGINLYGIVRYYVKCLCQGEYIHVAEYMRLLPVPAVLHTLFPSGPLTLWTAVWWETSSISVYMSMHLMPHWPLLWKTQITLKRIKVVVFMLSLELCHLSPNNFCLIHHDGACFGGKPLNFY